jgi:hypothetical protein
MDNFNIDVTSQGRANFDLAFLIAFSQYVKCKAYKIDKDKGFVLYWLTTEGAVNTLPYEMDWKETADFVWGWLLKNRPSKTPELFDGSYELGYRIYTEDWGHAGRDCRAFLAIKPIWALYGK